MAEPMRKAGNQWSNHIWGILIFLVTFSLAADLTTASAQNQAASPDHYLDEIKQVMNKTWPENQTINLVFHGHSVPSGYYKTPDVNTLESYQNQLLIRLKEQYPYAVINIIITAIGGENANSGEKRFKEDVLTHRPDVLFIDYALNDLGIGLEAAHQAWKSMIEQAQKQGIKVILLTPTPDQRIDLLDQNTDLEKHAAQIRRLATVYQTGLIDSYTLFRNRVIEGDALPGLMSQVNHPNAAGHKIVAEEILKYF